MAKISKDYSGDFRRAMLRSFYVYNRLGGTLMAAWPTKIKATKSEKQAAAMDLMRRRSLAIKAMDPQFVFAASNYAKVNALMPRDYLFMSIAGRGTQLMQPPIYLTGKYRNDGIRGAVQEAEPVFPFVAPPVYDSLRSMYSMANRDDLSFLLDIFTETPGGLLVRRPEGWRGLEPGTPGYVLTAGPDGLPNWGEASGGGGGLSIATSPNGSIDTQAYATKGNLFTAVPAVQYHGAYCDHDWVAGRSYKVSLVTAVAMVITAVRASSAPFVPATSYLGPRYIEFTSPYSAAAGEEVFLVLTCTSQTTTTALRVVASAAPVLNFPLAGNSAPVRLASVDPIVGETFSFGPGGTFQRVLPAWSLV